MPRRARSIVGGMVYHVLNRAVRREQLFNHDADYQAFERVLEEAHDREPIRILSYCVMPNHWHMLVWPRLGNDDQTSEFMRWLTLTHAQRWHAYFKTAGTGPVYQGRFKAFPVQDDRHLWTVLRYIERNPLRANLVRRAEDWQWSSLWRWSNGEQRGESLLSPLPESAGRRPRNWIQLVNQPHTEQELAKIRQCIAKGRPFGQPQWAMRQVKRLGLEATIRAPGRPGKARRR